MYKFRNVNIHRIGALYIAEAYLIGKVQLQNMLCLSSPCTFCATFVSTTPIQSIYLQQILQGLFKNALQSKAMGREKKERERDREKHSDITLKNTSLQDP